MSKKKMIFGERRLHVRKSCMFGVDINDYFRSYHCHLRDLSLGGALLEHPSHFKPALGQELLISINYRNKPGTVILKGAVVRSFPGQLAMVFEKNKPSTLHHAA